MHQGMGGKHAFDLVIDSNDPVEPQQVVTVKAKYPSP
jgi:hypothetical protein